MSLPSSVGAPTPTEPTLARLIQERLLRSAVVLTPEADLAQPVRWGHSLRDVLAESHPELDSVAVIADAGELTDTVWAILLRSTCSAVFLRADGDVRLPGHVLRSPLAVIRVPTNVTRRSLTELVAVLSLAHRAHVLEYGQRVHSALAHLLHRGAGLTALCTRLARLSGSAVAVLGTDLHLLAFDPGPDDRLDPHAVTGALRETRSLLAPAPEDPTSPHELVEFTMSVREDTVQCVAGAIELVEQCDGWVVLLDDGAICSQHDLAEHRVAVQQAITIVGTELLRVRGLERAEERARGNFVHALLHARFPHHADLVARASYYDFDVAGRYGVVVVHSGKLIARTDSSSRLAAMAREAERVLPHPERQTLTTVVGDVIAVIRRVSPARRAQPDPGIAELREYAVALDRQLSGRGRDGVLIAYGRPVDGADSIEESYREARIALDLRERIGVPEVCGFADLRVDSTLLDLAQQPVGREFAAEILDPLHEERDGSLAEVIRVYVEAGGNLNEAARRLSVHRNTMLYKLERISRLLQRDVRAPDAQFSVWLAIRLRYLAETAQRVNRDLASG